MTTSWVAVADGSDFPLENLPYGVVAPPGAPPRPVVRIGDHALDLALVGGAGLLDDVFGAHEVATAVCAAPTLNPLLAAGRPAWSALRERLTGLLADRDETLAEAGLTERALHRVDDVEVRLPVAVADYVDYYSSLHHATRVGELFRPDADPLLPNWRHLPVGYHGRAGTVVVSGTDVHRPVGQRRPGEDGRPPVGPSERLDFELEVGFVTGGPTALGTRVGVDQTADHVFGLVLVNDWSARDVQAWEYQPLGPYLGKSFATSISPWVVTLDALDAYRVRQPEQDPEPVGYLRVDGDWAYDLQLRVTLHPAGGEPTTVTAVNFAGMYWTVPQQLAHATVNGATLRPGDLFASGTVSGPTPDSRGCLLELSSAGREPLQLAGDVTRAFLEDGDTVTMTGWAGGDGRPRIGFGEVTGTILPAR